MSRKMISMFAPLGAVLATGFSSLTVYHAMNEIGLLMDTDQDFALPGGHLFGQVGLLLFGLGIANAALARRTRSAAVCGMFLAAAIAFGIAIFAIGFGTWQLFFAFGDFAGGIIVDGALLIQAVRMAKLPLLFGWGCVCVGAAAVFAADLIALTDETGPTCTILRATMSSATTGSTAIWKTGRPRSIRFGSGTSTTCMPGRPITVRTTRSPLIRRRHLRMC